MLGAVVVALTFGVHLLFTPLHLAWNHHLPVAPVGGHLHGHDGAASAQAVPRPAPHRHGDGAHAHRAQPEDPRPADSGHQPHSVVDHFDPLVLPQTRYETACARVESGLALPVVDARPRLAAGRSEVGPSPPPPRDAASARAPPIVV